MKISKRQLIRIIKEEKAVLEQSWRQNPAKIRRERRQRDRQAMIDTMTFEQLRRKAFDSALGIQGRLDTGQYEYEDIWEVEIPRLADYIDAARVKAAEEGVTYDDVPEVRHNGGIVDLSSYSLGDLPDTVKESKVRITKRQLRQIIREAVSGRGGPWADRFPERDSNWYPFARALDIGVLDLDNMAFDLGFDSWRDMDRSISPRRLARRDPAAFLAAARAASLHAEDMTDDDILGAAELPYEGR